MPRTDGKLVKNIPTFDKLIPRIMNKRYDATNYTRVEIDITRLNQYLRELRGRGHRVGLMDCMITSLALVMETTPEINRFVANKKIYQRNHRCVSFALIKRQNGELVETVIKLQIEKGDDLVKISDKIRAEIKKNKEPTGKNMVDKFVGALSGMPLLPSVAIVLFKGMDRIGILPRKIIDLSPFHTSMFISNLASIKMDYVYHHLYEFGTTSIFVTLGKPMRKEMAGETRQTIILGISIDERICLGAIWAKALHEFRHILENPERMGALEEIKIKEEVA